MELEVQRVQEGAEVCPVGHPRELERRVLEIQKEKATGPGMGHGGGMGKKDAPVGTGTRGEGSLMGGSGCQRSEPVLALPRQCPDRWPWYDTRCG